MCFLETPPTEANVQCPLSWGARFTLHASRPAAKPCAKPCANPES